MSIIISRNDINSQMHSDKNTLFLGDCASFLDSLPEEPIFDLVVTSPPYNIGKEYENKTSLKHYIEWQRSIISKIYPRLKQTGSICWQVGNYVKDGEIVPLDIALAPIFFDLNMQMRNRIIWHFGHGLHTKRRFSGRHEVIMWFTKSDEYVFNLDPVRIPAKYPGKRYFKGPKKGELSGNPLGKNPEDVWDIPNVKSNHIEKTIHPCQFPVGLIERLVLSMTDAGGLVFDPFAGVASSGVAAVVHGRHFWGCEMMNEYITIGKQRLDEAERGEAKYRAFDKPIYDATKTKLSQVPQEWTEGNT